MQHETTNRFGIFAILDFFIKLNKINVFIKTNEYEVRAFKVSTAEQPNNIL